ncbi:transcriptional regulator [halophilic archaeon]|nr:transcriptional regulator [halophilic archaeon]
MSELSREIDREILEILIADAPLRVMEIARTADRHPITVDQTCTRLHEQGQIRPVGRGLYDVTDEGKRRIGENFDS